MSFSLGPKGGITDPRILALLVKLTSMIKKHSFYSEAVTDFIDEHRDTVFVDNLSQHMHTFGELAEAVGPLINGIQLKPEDKIPGEGWKDGDFFESDESDPADWWKS